MADLMDSEDSFLEEVVVQTPSSTDAINSTIPLPAEAQNSPPPSPDLFPSQEMVQTKEIKENEGEKERIEAKQRLARTTVGFTFIEDYSAIYPAFATIAVRADEEPYYYLARVTDDILTGTLEFAVTWFDATPAGQHELYDLDREDFVQTSTVICRVALIPDLEARLLRLPDDQYQKIQDIIAKEKENPDYDYHSSDERWDDKKYMAHYYHRTGREEVSFPVVQKKRQRGPKKKPVEKEEEEEVYDYVSSELVDTFEDDYAEAVEPKRKRQRTSTPTTPTPHTPATTPRTPRTPRAPRSESLPGTPSRKRGRPRLSEEEKQRRREEKEVEFKPKKAGGRGRPRKSRSPAKPKTPTKRARSPTKSKSPGRKKVGPNLDVATVEFDPSYCFDSSQINVSCCSLCSSKIEPLRACLTNNIELLKSLAEAKTSISSLNLQRSLVIAVTPMVVAVRRAILTIAETEDDINTAMACLEKKVLSEASKEGKSPVDDEMEHDFQKPIENGDQTYSMDMIESRVSTGAKLSPLEEIAQGEHNQFTTLRILLLKDIHNNRTHPASPKISKMEQGHGSRYNRYRSSSASIGVSRGGKEGNNALLHDVAPYYENYYTYVEDAFREALESVLPFRTVSFPSLRSMYYLFPELQTTIFESMPAILRSGNRRLAARLFHELDSEYMNYFNFLHSEILTFEHDQELSKIRTPASVTKKGVSNITPLHIACIQSTSKYLIELLKLKPEAIGVIDSDGYGLIHYAAACESPEPLKVLLARHVNIRTCDTKIAPPLTIAARLGRIENIQLLLADRDPTEVKSLLEQSSGRLNNTALHEAAIHNQIDCIEILHLFAQKNAAALIEAAYAKAEGAGETLKRKPTTTLTNYLNRANRLRQPPLTMACEHGNMAAIKLLLELGAKINQPDKSKKTPLVAAIMNGCLTVCSHLIRMGADPNLPDSSNNTPLHYACAYGWKEIVKFLVAPRGVPTAPLPGAGVPPECYNDWKLTPLGITMAKGHLGIADLLLADSSVRVDITNDEGLSLLSQTVNTQPSEGVLQQTKYLVSKGANVNSVDLEGFTALHHLILQTPVIEKTRYSSGRGSQKEREEAQQQKLKELCRLQLETAQVLLSKDKTAINLSNNAGSTPLQLAIKKEAFDIIRLLIENDADLTFINPQSGENILHTLAVIVEKHSVIEIFSLLQSKLGQSAYDMLLQSEDHWGFTPFLFFFQRAMALSASEDVTTLKVIKETLQFFLGSTEVSLLTQTVGRLKQWRTYSEESLQEKALVLLKKKILEKIQKSRTTNSESELQLLREDECWEEQTIDLSYLSDPALYSSATKNRNIIVVDTTVGKEIIQEHEISLLHPGYGSAGKNCVLHLVYPAARTILEYLFASFQPQLINVLDQYNVSGFMPLHLALAKKDLYMAHCLLNLSVNVPIPSRSSDLSYPIHYVVNMQDKTLLRRIISCAPQNINVIDSEGKTPLIIACQNRWRKGALILLEAGAAVNLADKQGQTALHHAVKSARGVDSGFGVEEVLLNFAIDVNMKDKHLRTALHYAFCNDLKEDSLSQPSNCKAFDPIETVSSLCAIDSLLVDEVDILGNSPLCYASHVAATICSLYLIRRGAQVNRTNKEGNSPLSLSLQAGFPEFAIVLIQNAANVQHLLYNVKKEKKTIWTKKRAFLFCKETVTSKTLFKYAVTQNWQGVAYTLLDSGFDIQQAVEDTLTSSKFRYLETLLRKSRSVTHFETKNDQNQNLFHLLASITTEKDGEWSVKIAKQFSKKSVDAAAVDIYGRTPLHYASLHLNYKLCEYFLVQPEEMMLDVDSDDETSMALDPDQKQTGGCGLDPNVKDNEGNTSFSLLFHAIGKRKYSPQLNDKWFSLITLFSRYHVLSNVLFPVNKTPESLDILSYTSPLHFLLQNCHDGKNPEHGLAFFKNLLSNKEMLFDIDQVDGSGRTCLMRAIQLNNVPFVKLLLGLGASVRVKDHAGKSLVHYVVEPLPFGSYENTEILDLLAAAGAPLSEKDKDGNTPIYICMTKQASTTLYEHLRSLGVKPQRVPLSRTPTMAAKSTEYLPVPDYEADAKQTLLQVKVTREYKPPTLDALVAKKGARELFSDTTTFYHAILTIVDVKNGRYGVNNFYKLQIAHDTLKDIYILLTKWGRIGENGQHQSTPFNNAQDAITEFERVFKQKSGNSFNTIPFVKKADKYRLLEENRYVQQINTVLLPVQFLIQEKVSQGMAEPACSLPPAIKEMMSDFCDVKRMREQLRNTLQVKTPLGYLNQETIQKGLDLLHEIQNLLVELDEKRKIGMKMPSKLDVGGIRSLMETLYTLSNDYYELVPINSENSDGIIPIDSISAVSTQFKRIDLLRYFATASKFLLAAQHRCRVDGVHPYDYVFSCLSSIIKPLDPSSDEYQILLNCFPSNVSVKEIFSVERKGEPERIGKWCATPNHHLLWHGTSTFNFLGVLSNGMKIAPPEAPQSGMMFGRGIYHSDAFVKAKKYVSAPKSYALLNEVVLGSSYTIRASEYMENAPIGHQSTKAEGFHQPTDQITLANGLTIHYSELVKQPNAPKGIQNYQVQHNEFIVYDESQVRLRYMVKFN